MFVLIDMIDNIILNPYYVTRTPANESAVHGHVTQAETRDHYTALPLVEVLVCIYEFSYNLTQIYINFSRQEPQVELARVAI